jgi:hypothetical protein
MSTLYPDLFLALQEYFAAIEQKAPASTLLPLIQTLDDWDKKLESVAPSELRHYLQRKSYEKAWLFLQGREIEHRHPTGDH